MRAQQETEGMLRMDDVRGLNKGTVCKGVGRGCCGHPRAW